MKGITLKPFQKDAVRAVLKEWDKGNRKTLLISATGTGKTVMFVNIAENALKEHPDTHVLILAHREELLQQAIEKIERYTDVSVSLEKGASSSEETPIIVGSVQTMCREKRLERFPRDYFGYIMVDEAHHSTADTYQKILNYFDRAKVLGVTATPDRMDERALANFYDSRAFEYTLLDAIKDKNLAPVKIRTVPLKLDIRHVHKTAGDYNPGELDITIEPYLKAIAGEMKKYCDGRTTLVFTPLISTSEKFMPILKKEGFRVCEVHGTSEDREQKIKDIKAGKYDVILNAMLLTEGFDADNIDCIVSLRATKSRSLYCLDEQTEVLTRNGWKKDVNVGDDVLAFDIKTNETRFVPAIAKIRRPLRQDECFYSIKGQVTNIRVTNHHRMIYDNKRYLGWKIKEVQDLAQLRDGARIPVSGHGNFPGVPLTDAELTFIGWVMTDGTINKLNGTIAISQSESHEEYCNEIESCIRACNFKYSKRICKRKGVAWNQHGDNVIFTISYGKPRGTNKDKTGWGRLAPWLSKDVSERLYDMTEEQFAVMLEAIWHGDGNKHQTKTYSICKGNKTFIERLQIMAIQRGYRANVFVQRATKENERKNDLWYVKIKKQDYSVIGSAFDKHAQWIKEPYTAENCWCVQNELGTLITRRNGIVSIVGNCQMIGRGTRLCKERPDKDLLLLDFLWQTEKFDIMSPASLVADSDYKALEMTKKSVNREADIFDLESEVMRDIEAERERSLASTLRSLRLKKGRLIDPLQYVYSTGDERLKSYEPVYAWENDKPTDKQAAMLSRNGFDMSKIKTKGQANVMISAIIKRRNDGFSTPKQIKCLENYNFTNVGLWKFGEASAMIDSVAKNGWKVPAGVKADTYKPPSLTMPGKTH